MPDLAEKFMSRVSKGEGTDDCWIYTGPKNYLGYGRFYVPGKKDRQKAHRVSYELFVGPIPYGMHICHRCDNPSCVRPSHLFAGTQEDNMKDMAKKGRGTIGKSPWIKGKKQSPETIRKRQKSLIKYKYRVIFPTGEIHEPHSLGDFAKTNGLPVLTLFNIARGHRKAYKGIRVERS